MKKAISVETLTKYYGQKKAVDNVSFEVEKGSIFGLLGHNGAGKTTTIECILGTKDYESGKITVLSNDIGRRKDIFQKIGVQFQNTAYQYKIKVKELCEINQSLYKKANDWKPMLEEFGLGDNVDSFVDDLSGGERQKLYIILAVMHNPELVFLDELTTGLDPKARRDVWKYILNLKQNGTTIFLTSHYMDEVEHLCDEIMIINQGKTVIQGTVPHVIDKSGTTNMDDAFLYFVEEETI